MATNRVTRSRKPDKSAPKSTEIRHDQFEESSNNKDEPALILAISKLTNQLTILSDTFSIIAERLDKLEKVSKKQKAETDNIKVMLTNLTDATASLSSSTRDLSDTIEENHAISQVKEECHKVKSTMQVTWKDTMNYRKKAFWHSLQNYGKAKLYTEWIEHTSPDYLPLKYRPRVNDTDYSEATENKIEAAEKRYHEDVNLMQQYHEEHAAKVKILDREMETTIYDKAETVNHAQILLNMWYEETEINEAISEELWQKRRQFLNSKRLQEEEAREHQTVYENRQPHERFDKVKKRGQQRYNTRPARDPDDWRT